MVAAHREHARLRVCAEREPARDPSRGRKGAVCAEAGALAQTSPDGPLENAICQTGGGILSRDCKIDQAIL